MWNLGDCSYSYEDKKKHCFDQSLSSGFWESPEYGFLGCSINIQDIRTLFWSFIIRLSFDRSFFTFLRIDNTIKKWKHRSDIMIYIQNPTTSWSNPIQLIFTLNFPHFPTISFVYVSKKEEKLWIIINIVFLVNF